MTAIDELRNDKDTVFAIVSEYYNLNAAEKIEIKIRPFKDHECSRPENHIYHGAWRFCYHRDVAILYIE